VALFPEERRRAFQFLNKNLAQIEKICNIIEKTLYVPCLETLAILVFAQIYSAGVQA